MLKWAGNIFLIVALVAATGTQWLVLQSVAWAGMIVRYSGKESIKTALAETFDGRHPCPLCRVVASGKKSERENGFTSQLKKLEFPPAPENFILVAPSHFELLPLENSFGEELLQEPPLPPPRASFGQTS